MQLETLKKVTIIIEDSVKIHLAKKICELGASGYTSREVQGYGSRGARSDPFASNVEIEVICPETVAHSILSYVSETFFENHACIAWLTEVQVVRGSRYAVPVASP